MSNVDVNKNTPEKKFRASPMTATVWTNEVQGRDGETNSPRRDATGPICDHQRYGPDGSIRTRSVVPTDGSETEAER